MPVGTAGSGRSTPATLIAGPRAPDEGSVLLGGTPTGDLAAHRLSQAAPDDLRAARRTYAGLWTSWTQGRR
ncbi:hypothetical protein ABZ341_28590 [Streptomyces sp. NPDC006173]|uniref:hypothetical protein n=1 Tax=Streptomyces sp. NPDC006173 TaxID=3155349 RepID=UPI0033D08C09